MFKHPKSSDEALKLFLKSIKYDFALLKLEKPIKREKYPLLVPNFREEQKLVTVCGYGNDYQVSHSNPLMLEEEGGRYNIDTEEGQSGAPVFFIEDIGAEEEVCHLVGVHKGYEKKANLNICTLITD